MSLNISAVNSSSSNLYNVKKSSKKSDSNFSIDNDPVVDGIYKEEKDPVDREEDLLFWKESKENFGFKKGFNYDDFKELKKEVVGFPPATAPGYVRKEYREKMNKLPQNVRNKIEDILTFTYGEFVNGKNIDASNFGNVIDAMKEHIGQLGDPATTDFGFINEFLDGFKSQVCKETNK
ncbi:MAG: hypothetical protein PHX70_06555 [Clostridium sp.]|nr:hypothetical protein [Clostridium sp.]